MLRRYELTDEEWNRIAPLLPPKNTGKQGRPRKDTRTILNGRSSSPAAVHLGETCRSVTALGRLCTVVFVSGSTTGFWITFFAL